MKKATVLAVSLVLAAVISAVWLGREQLGGEQSAPSVADSSLSRAEPSITEDSATELDIERTEAAVEAAPPPEFPSTGPVRLFSSPDYGSIEYRNAFDSVSRYIAEYKGPPTISSTHLLKRNEAAIDELIHQLGSNPDGLITEFEISPSEIRLCTVSTINRHSPEFEPGLPVPARFRAEAKCDDSVQEVTIGVDRDRTGIVSLAFRSPTLGGMRIATLDDSGYAVAFQLYPDPPSPTGH